MYYLAALDSCKDKILAAAAALAGSSILEASPLVLTMEQPVLGRGKGLAALTKHNPCFSNTRAAVAKQTLLKCPANICAAVAISATREEHSVPGILRDSQLQGPVQLLSVNLVVSPGTY